MGVKGLTTYLKENRHQLSHTRELKSNGGTPVETVNVVVDGWSLLYALYIQSGEPWVYGGEYLTLSRHAEDLISAWIRVGIRPTFVFDGPAPPLKYPTLITRLQDSYVKPANLFFRTSQAARTTSRSLSENRIALPLGYPALVSTFLAMEGVDVKFAEGEADPYIVTLAGELRAYVVGKDSDFVVLNSEGYRGYIPLDELVWSVAGEDAQSGMPMVGELDSGFQTVSRKKQRKQTRMTTGLLPLTHNSDLVLLITIYEPSLLASHIDLPVPLLPLLGALIGNDYAALDFFRSSESVVDRVRRVASTLSSVFKDAQSNNAKKVRQVFRGNNGGAMDVIGTTIERLLVWRDPRNPPENREIDQFTDTIVQSTVEYAVGASTSLFPDTSSDEAVPEVSPGRQLFSRKERVRNLYLQAFHQGSMHCRLMEAFCRGICFPTMFLEDPDKESVTRSIGKPIRSYIWQLFVAAGGIPEPVDGSGENVDGKTSVSSDFPDTDEDELIDVIEEDSIDSEFTEAEVDPLVVLRGRIQRMSFSESEAQFTDIEHLRASDILDGVEEEEIKSEEEDENGDEFIELPQIPKTITEYLRKGARVTGEEEQITDVEKTFWYDSPDKIPVQLRPLSERTAVFLKLLGSDTHHIRKMMMTSDRQDRQHLRKYLLWVVAYRWILQMLHSRCEDVENSQNRKRLREEERWTRTESEAFFYSLCSVSTSNEEDNERPLPLVTDRAIQLTAQLLAAFEAVEWLAQALLLMTVPGQSTEDGPPLVLGEAERMFSGRQFHASLLEPHKQQDEEAEYLRKVADEGLAHMLAQPKGKKVKKTKVATPASPAAGSRNSFPASGRFSALVDLDNI